MFNHFRRTRDWALFSTAKGALHPLTSCKETKVKTRCVRNNYSSFTQQVVVPLSCILLEFLFNCPVSSALFAKGPLSFPFFYCFYEITIFFEARSVTSSNDAQNGRQILSGHHRLSIFSAKSILGFLLSPKGVSMTGRMTHCWVENGLQWRRSPESDVRAEWKLEENRGKY